MPRPGNRSRVTSTWCLGLVTAETEESTAGIFVGNSSGNQLTLIFPTLYFITEWDYNYITYVFLFPVGEQTSWLKCCWGLELQTSQAASGEQKWWWEACENLIDWVIFLHLSTLCWRGLTTTTTKANLETILLSLMLTICADSPACGFSSLCQTVQEEGARGSGGALRLQRLRLPDGDDRPRQTAQLHRRRSESRDLCCLFMWCFSDRSLHCLPSDVCCSHAMLANAS